MINILPADLRGQLKYAKLNALLLKYLSLATVVGMLLGSILIASFWYTGRQIKEYQQILAARQADRVNYKDIEARVASLQSNLNLIDKLLTEKTRYSELLGDLAAALPGGSYITQMTLTGDDKQPLQLAVNVDSFNRAAEVRNGLIGSDRINNADIQSIAKSEDGGGFTVAIVAAFEAGRAR